MTPLTSKYERKDALASILRRPEAHSLWLVMHVTPVRVSPRMGAEIFMAWARRARAEGASGAPDLIIN